MFDNQLNNKEYYYTEKRFTNVKGDYKRKSVSGFTIVELIIVISVIAVLSVLLVPAFSQIITKAKKSNIYLEANTIFKNYLVKELKDSDIPEYVIIKLEEDICVIYFKGEQIQETLSFSEVKEKVEKDNEFVIIQIENYSNIYISEKIQEENIEQREIEFIIIDGVLMWRYRGDVEWTPVVPLDDVGCTIGS